MSDKEEQKLFGVKPLWVAIVAAAVVVIAVGGYFAFQKGTAAHKGASPGTAQSAAAEPAPGGTCGTALARVRDYGVVPFNSTLSGDVEGKKAAQGRIECAAASGNKTYSMLVDVSCDDMSNPKCLDIYRVTQGDGNALFQKRPYSF